MLVTVICQILEETYKLEFLYSGLETRQVATIHHVRLQAKALQLVLTARTKRGLGLLLAHTLAHTHISCTVSTLSVEDKVLIFL